MSRRKPVLVVVDVQNGFITEHSKPRCPRHRRLGAPMASRPWRRDVQPVPEPRRQPLRATDGERGWTDLYLCGIDTDMCVLKTAVDASNTVLPRGCLRTPAPAMSAPKPTAPGCWLLIARRFVGANQIIRTSSLPESTQPV